MALQVMTLLFPANLFPPFLKSDRGCFDQTRLKLSSQLRHEGLGSSCAVRMVNTGGNEDTGRSVHGLQHQQKGIKLELRNVSTTMLLQKTCRPPYLPDLVELSVA
ncbi:uncharacterized protein LOC131325927 isoform X7 [Rhododendron vialii]|uniref:uncharacterized protein LOC131325927 isoform X7 n=1 Tax=Rhododendron vialii TaxID=182163 RepID=UPI00266009CE|nr:uncharacterized protein LOC131325927 isoform X7 [Rhododendron vialii]